MKIGFSLVELSIVLVILGLLVGGILAGQSLIHAAELRTVTRDYQNHLTAIQTFRGKYFQLPGDMNNAVKFWGAQAGATTDGTDATCIALTAAATGTATCNGNGDNEVSGTATLYHEMFRFWQHLANAGLIEGSFSGVKGSGSAFEHLVGTNCPRGRIGISCWEAVTYATVTGGGSSILYDGSYGLTLILGTQWTAQQPLQGLVKPEDAWNIDTKIDDGKPGVGILLGPKMGWGSCTTSTTASSAEYDLDNISPECFFIFRAR